MQAQDVMTRRVITVAEATPIEEVARLLAEHRISAVPVVDEGGGVAGIVSEGDLIGRLDEGGDRSRSWWLELLSSPDVRAREQLRSHGRTAGEVMSRQVVTCAEDTPIVEIARRLEAHRIKRLPVIREGRLVGLVSRADLLRAFAATAPATRSPTVTDDRALRQRLLDELEATGMSYHPYVNIVVSDGEVHLWGLVANQREAEALRSAAEHAAAGGAVHSHLAVRPASSAL